MALDGEHLEMKNLHIFRWPLFPGELYYFQQCKVSNEEINRFIQSGGNSEGVYHGFDCSHANACCYDLGTSSIIVMPNCSTNPSILIHECTHAALNLMRAVGAEDDETLCYLVEWAFDQIFPIWNIETTFDC